MDEMSSTPTSLDESPMLAGDPHRRFWRITRRCILVTVLVGLFAWIMAPVVLMVVYPFGIDDGPTAPNPPDDFHHLTGWYLPADAQVLFAENTASGFRGDGEYTLIVQTTPATVDGWISSAGAHTWKPFPLLVEIQESCWNLPNHDATLYRAEKYDASDADWHRGTIVMVNSTTGKVWVYAWKN